MRNATLLVVSTLVGAMAAVSMEVAVAKMRAAFSPEQCDAVNDFMRANLQDAGNEAAANVARQLEETRNILSQVADSQGRVSAMMHNAEGEQAKIKEVMEMMDKKAQDMRVTLDQAKSALEQSDQKTRHIQSILEQMDSKQAALEQTIETQKESMETAVKQSSQIVQQGMTTVSQVWGGMGERMSQVEKKLEEVVGRAQFLDGQVAAMKGGYAGPTEASSSVGPYDDRAYEKALIPIKEIKLPIIPSASPTPGEFRKWWRDMWKYCQRREKHWRGAESLFNVLRTYPNVITPLETNNFITALNARESAEGGHGFRFDSEWGWPADRDKEMYECVEYALNGKCADIFGQVMAGCGFEALRRLARRFDPVSPQAAAMIKGMVYATAGKPCKNFAQTVERHLELQRLQAEMRDTAGEELDAKVLAEVFFPAMDASCQSEIVALRVKIGSGDTMRDIDIGNFDDLTEYVRNRTHRERTLISVTPTKMDIGMVDGAAGMQLNSYIGGTADSQSNDDTVYSGWSYWGNQFEEENPERNDLDALKKGKGKGSKPLQCYLCRGNGHPKKACTSPEDPKSNGLKCENCKGLGHTKPHCPSQGGGKYKPPPMITDTPQGKGKGDKGGKGAGTSRYFYGKGSGVSSVENGQADEWAAWQSGETTSVAQAAAAIEQHGAAPTSPLKKCWRGCNAVDDRRYSGQRCTEIVARCRHYIVRQHSVAQHVVSWQSIA